MAAWRVRSTRRLRRRRRSQVVGCQSAASEENDPLWSLQGRVRSLAKRARLRHARAGGPVSPSGDWPMGLGERRKRRVIVGSYNHGESWKKRGGPIGATGRPGLSLTYVHALLLGSERAKVAVSCHSEHLPGALSLLWPRKSLSLRGKSSFSGQTTRVDAPLRSRA